MSSSHPSANQAPQPLPWYRYGSWMVVHGSCAHVVGFSTSFWLSHDASNNMGLWTRCRNDLCHHLLPGAAPGWLVSVRVLACTSIVLMALWLLKFQCRCFKARRNSCRLVQRLEEVLTIVSGCCALLAVVVFAVASGNDLEFKDFSLSWSLWLVVGGVSASTLGGFIIAVTRTFTHNAPKPNTRTIGPSGRPAGPERGPLTATSTQLRLMPRDDVRRHHNDVMNIFNVSTEAEFQRGRNSPFCWTDVGQTPPPYSLSVARGHTSCFVGGQNEPISAHALALSPPPPYEVVVNDPPPPYRPAPSLPAGTCEPQ